MVPKARQDVESTSKTKAVTDASRGNKPNLQLGTSNDRADAPALQNAGHQHATAQFGTVQLVVVDASKKSITPKPIGAKILESVIPLKVLPGFFPDTKNGQIL